jgi:hypothetical protein
MVKITIDIIYSLSDIFAILSFFNLGIKSYKVGHYLSLSHFLLLLFLIFIQIFRIYFSNIAKLKSELKQYTNLVDLNSELKKCNKLQVLSIFYCIYHELNTLLSSYLIGRVIISGLTEILSIIFIVLVNYILHSYLYKKFRKTEKLYLNAITSSVINLYKQNYEFLKEVYKDSNGKFLDEFYLGDSLIEFYKKSPEEFTILISKVREDINSEYIENRKKHFSEERIKRKKIEVERKKKAREKAKRRKLDEKGKGDNNDL